MSEPFNLDHLQPFELPLFIFQTFTNSLWEPRVNLDRRKGNSPDQRKSWLPASAAPEELHDEYLPADEVEEGGDDDDGGGDEGHLVDGLHLCQSVQVSTYWRCRRPMLSAMCGRLKGVAGLEQGGLLG